MNNVSIDLASAVVPYGGVERLHADVSPEDAGNRKVKWSAASSDGNGEVSLFTDQNCTNAVGSEAVETYDVFVRGDAAGGATVTATSDSDNSLSATCAVIVNKIDSSVTAVPQGKQFPYTGGNEPLVEAGTAEGGEMQYSLDGETYAPEVPTASDAGDYTIWYKVVGDDNHYDTEASSVTSKIECVDSSVTAAPQGKQFPYTGGNEPLVEAGTAEGGEMQYSLDGKTYSPDVPTASEAGEYTIWYKVVGDDNHNDTEASSVTSKIERVDSSVTAAPQGKQLTYTGKKQALVEVGTADGGEMQYSLDGKTYSPEVPTASDAGEYTIWYKVVADNDHVDTEASSVTLKIERADSSVTVAPQGKQLTYTGKKQALVDAGTAEGGVMQYSLDGKSYSDEVPTGTDAKEYAVWYKVAGDKNHNDTEAKQVTSTITKNDEPVATYKVTVSNAAGGSVSVDKTTAQAGATVNVTATPADGYGLEAVTVDGEAIGGKSFKMPAHDVTVSARFKKTGTAPTPTPAPTPGALTLSGSGHVQDVGDVDGTASGEGLLIGTTGESRRLESFWISLPKGTDGTISYRGHVQDLGWTGWVAGGDPCGTTAQSLRLEAVQVSLGGALASDHSIWYRVHSQDHGWLGWARDGEPAGTAGQSLRAESVEALVLPAGQVPADYDPSDAAFDGTTSGHAHVQESGWIGRNGTRFGTEGLSRRLEALSLSAVDLPWESQLATSVHVQDLGWMATAADGEVAGTTGESRRLEAVRMTLGGEASAYVSVWYRVHCQDYGWLGWASDGQPAGTEGMSLRAECVEVQLLPTGKVPSDYTSEPAFLSAA